MTGRLCRLFVPAGLALALWLGVVATAGAAGGRNGVDCNGFGRGATTSQPANYACTEIRQSSDERFEDNGHYVGHDEPLIAYYSNSPGSGYRNEYHVRLPLEPPALPTGSKNGPIDTYMLGPAFWFSMILCDTESFPEGSSTCTPHSDSNIQVPFAADHAGAAFLEMQFYPPGWPPFITQFSCDMTHWCASLHINSLQGNFDFSQLNSNCLEPTAFAFLTRSGIPGGPAGPDDFTAASFTPTADTFLMNPGDDIVVTIKDTPNGIFTGIKDLTTGQKGSMVASAGNGFRHIIWDPDNFTCNGEPYSYHAMYATSQPIAPGGVPVTWAGWTAHTVNVSASWEIGHFEKPDEDRPNREEGPCFDGPTIPGCIGTDSDFDGYAYKEGVWPDGSPLHPTALAFSSPHSGAAGAKGFHDPFAAVNFETDLPAIEPTCNVFTLVGCSNPPPGAAFYPFPHTQTLLQSRCGWSIGADVPNQLDNFGGNPTVAWGPPEVIDYGAGFVAALNYATGAFPNPCP